MKIAFLRFKKKFFLIIFLISFINHTKCFDINFPSFRTQTLTFAAAGLAQYLNLNEQFATVITGSATVLAFYIIRNFSKK